MANDTVNQCPAELQAAHKKLLSRIQHLNLLITQVRSESLAIGQFIEAEKSNKIVKSILQLNCAYQNLMRNVNNIEMRGEKLI